MEDYWKKSPPKILDPPDTPPERITNADNTMLVEFQVLLTKEEIEELLVRILLTGLY